MAEGARECWGLAEWNLSRGWFQRPHLRYLAQLTPAQRQQALSASGLAFTRMSPAQQQQFISLRAQNIQSLEELAGATLRVGYTQPGGFQWAVPEAQPIVTLELHQSELGQYTLDGHSGFAIPNQNAAGKVTFGLSGRGPYVSGWSPAVLQPNNREANAKLAGDPTLRARVSCPTASWPVGRRAAVSTAL